MRRLWCTWCCFQLAYVYVCKTRTPCGICFIDFDGGKKIKAIAKSRVESVMQQYAGKQENTQSTDNVDTWVYPLIQMGPFGIDMDQTVTQNFLQHCESGSRVSMASAYFNLIPNYVDLILRSPAKFDIYTASPTVYFEITSRELNLYCHSDWAFSVALHTGSLVKLCAHIQCTRVYSAASLSNYTALWEIANVQSV